jgi:hypothetical protein
VVNDSTRGIQVSPLSPYLPLPPLDILFDRHEESRRKEEEVVITRMNND